MIVIEVWTGVGFSNLKNFRTWIQKFWNRSGVGVWICDSSHLWQLASPRKFHDFIWQHDPPACPALRLVLSWTVVTARIRILFTQVRVQNHISIRCSMISRYLDSKLREVTLPHSYIRVDFWIKLIEFVAHRQPKWTIRAARDSK